ncbi:MAG: ROK family protein [Chloroflexi bacterium]|nr:ROK family protein [Chloroflexota bacterium]
MRLADEAVGATDLGGTRLRVALIDREGRLLCREEMPTLADAGPEQAMERLSAALEQMRAQTSPVHLRGMGLALPGPLDPDTGMLHHPPNLPGWHGFSPKRYLAERLSLHVLANNDANLAALGEHRYGFGRGLRHLVFVIWGTGIGGGLILDGRLYEGVNGFAGEVGHLVVEPDGPRCGCGGQGCLEALASGQAMARRARELVEAGRQGDLLRREVDGDLQRISVESLVKADLLGDPVARKVLEDGAAYLGVGLATLWHTLDPELVVLGGGVSHILHRALPIVRREARRHAMTTFRGNPPPLLPSQLGDDAGLLGAAALVWGWLEGA